MKFTSNEYVNFKHLLEYFVAHLEEPPKFSTGEDGWALVKALEESRK